MTLKKGESKERQTKSQWEKDKKKEGLIIRMVPTLVEVCVNLVSPFMLL